MAKRGRPRRACLGDGVLPSPKATTIVVESGEGPLVDVAIEGSLSLGKIGLAPLSEIGGSAEGSGMMTWARKPNARKEQTDGNLGDVQADGSLSDVGQPVGGGGKKDEWKFVTRRLRGPPLWQRG
ncbi:hypothetical protein Dimus_001995 [Dionaea muscipula]